MNFELLPLFFHVTVLSQANVSASEIRFCVWGRVLNLVQR